MCRGEIVESNHLLSVNIRIPQSLFQQVGEIANQSPSGAVKPEGHLFRMKSRNLELFGNFVMKCLQDANELAALTNIGPRESWQLNRGEKSPCQLLVPVNHISARTESGYDERCTGIIDQDFEPISDVMHDLALASVIEVLKLIDHDHPSSRILHQYPEPPGLLIFRSPLGIGCTEGLKQFSRQALYGWPAWYRCAQDWNLHSVVSANWLVLRFKALQEAGLASTGFSDDCETLCSLAS